MDPNTANINVLIKSQIDTTKALADLQSFSNQAKGEAQKLNKVLEAAFKMPSATGRGGGIFGNMLQSIREMQKSVNTVSTTIRESMGDVKSAVDSVKDSIMNLSTSINGLTSKKHKVQVEQEITQTVKGKSGKKTVIDSSPTAMGIVGKTKVSAAGENLYSEFLDTNAEIKQKALSAKASREYRRRIDEAEARDRQRVNPLSAHQYAMDLQKKQLVNRGKAVAPFVESEMIRQKTAYEDKQNFDKLDADAKKKANAVLKQKVERQQDDYATSQKLQKDIDKMDLAEYQQYLAQTKAIHNSINRKRAERAEKKEQKEQAQFESEKKIHQEYLTFASQKNAYLKAQEADRKRVTPESATKYALSKPRVGAMTPTEAATFYEVENQQNKDNAMAKAQLAKEDAERTNRNRVAQKSIDRLRRKKEDKELKRIQYEISQLEKKEKAEALARKQDEKAGLYDSQRRILKVDKPVTPYDRSRLSAFGTPDQARWGQGDFKSGDAFINDAKRYVKYAVNDLGMSIEDAMKNISKSTAAKSLSKDRPGGEFAGRIFGNKSDYEKAMRDISGSVTGIHSPLDAAGKKMGILSSMMERQGEAVRRLGRYYASFFMITSSIQVFTESMRQAVAMQDQMLELKKFLPEGSNIGGLRQNAYSMAAEFGVPIDTVLGSFTEFAKQGKQANEILDLTRSALLGVNVASTDFATTVTYLTTVTNVWKNQFSDTSVLIDKLALVQAKSSASSEVLISAMQRSGSMAKTMGVSLDQLFGYISAVSEKTQLSGEVIGTSLKTILERAQRMKTLNLLQGMEEFKGQQFVSPISGDIMAAPQILEAVAKKWGTLTDVQRKYIGEQMAGSRQLNAFTALMENMGRAAELTRDSMNSLGFAQKANESEMAKFSKSFQKITTQFGEMTTSVLLPLIGAATSFLNVLSAIGSSAPGLVSAFAGMFVGASALSTLASVFRSFRKEIGHAMNAVVMFFATIGKAKTVGAGFTQALGNTSAWSGIVKNWTLMSSGLSMIAVSGTRAAGAMRGLWGAMNLVMGPIGLAISAASMGWMAYSSMTESAAEKQKEMNEKLAEAIKLFKELSSAKSEQQRLEISRKIAQDLGASGMAGMKMERDPLSGALIPAYSKASDAQYNKEIMAIKNVGISELPDATSNIVDLAKVFDEADKKLKRFIGKTIEDEKEVVQTLLTVRGLMSGDNRDIGSIISDRISELEKSKSAYKGRTIDKDTANALDRLDEEEIVRLRNIQNAMSGKTEQGRLSKSFFESIGKIPSSAFTKILRSEDVSKNITNIMQSSDVLKKPETVGNINDQLEAEARLRQRNLEYVRQMADAETDLRQRRLTTRSTSSDDYLAKYALATEEILQLNKDLLSQQKELMNTERTFGDTANISSKITDTKNLIEAWQRYREEINGITTGYSQLDQGINVVSSTVRSALNSAIESAIAQTDNLSSKLLNLSSQTFTIKVAVEAFLRSMLPGWLSGMLFGGEFGNIKDPLSSVKENLSTYESIYKKAPADLKKQYSQSLVSKAEKDLATLRQGRGSAKLGTPEYNEQLRQEMELQKRIDSMRYKDGGGAAKRDRESTAHYNALERIKKAEADLQKQQQMSSYWEGKMPDKYLLKYDAETAKYNAELKAKQAALDSERANLKPEEVKKLQEEINVLNEKIALQTKYRKQAEEIAAFEKWQSDNRVGMERLRTELSIKSEIYDMEYAALYSPSRADEKSYMEWKIKSAITELEAQRLIAIEEQKIVAIKNGKSEAEALSIAMSTEEVQLLDIKLQKEQQMLGLVDRQLELKKQQRINEQVREVQGMISTGIFDALSMKSKNERKKQLAEIAKELSNLSEDSNTAAYGIAQAESVGNIDAINASRDKWNEVNRQIEEARKKMDEVNNSTNKWKEVLENIGDSVLKKLADKFAEMLINKTGLGDMLGMVFGGIDGINTGGKGVKGQALPAASSALAALSLKSPQQSLKMAQDMMGLMVPGSSGSTNYNVSVAGGGGNPLGALLGGGLKFGGAGTSALGGGFAGSKLGANAGFGKAASASSASKYGTSQYLTSAMLGYAIGSSTSNRTVGVLGGAAAGFLTGGPIGALIGGIASLFGRKKDDTPPPVQPQREFYALFKNSESLDRNTSALLKLSEGIYNQPSTFEVNKLQAERNMTSPVFNITINATSNSPKAIASEVNAVISNSYQTSLAKTATSTSNWG